MQASFSLERILHAPKPSLIAVREIAAADSFIPALLAELAVRGEPCGVIVANNRLDVYAIGAAAARVGESRVAALQKIFIVRAETCQQLHGCLQRLLTKPLRFRFLFVLGFLEPFYDEDIRFARAGWLLTDSLRHMRLLTGRGATLIVTLDPPPAHSARLPFLAWVQQRVDVCVNPETPALDAPLQPGLEL